ncbi:SNF2 domain-containing protein [Abeliophyllum distichum]|uniref:SNF2 domain-containing protein n=1 Tax=Abeliophyllum distichum TaxID=126358 RepID=A0ABD1UP74_9LAMI
MMPERLLKVLRMTLGREKHQVLHHQILYLILSSAMWRLRSCLTHSLSFVRTCCHPQVGSSGLRSLQKSPMTMEEILSVLVGKTKVEGEDALRKLVVALNGLAAYNSFSMFQEALKKFFLGHVTLMKRLNVQQQGKKLLEMIPV